MMLMLGYYPDEYLSPQGTTGLGLLLHYLTVVT